MRGFDKVVRAGAVVLIISMMGGTAVAQNAKHWRDISANYLAKAGHISGAHSRD